MIELYNITNLSGTSTFTITPSPGYALSASQFTTVPATSYYSSITFADSGEPGTLNNTVVGTVNWITQSISADVTLPTIDLSSIEPTVLPKQYNSIIDVYHEKSTNADAVDYFTSPTFLTNTTWNETTGVAVFTGDAGLTYFGQSGLWPSNSEDNQVFTLTYTISNSNFTSTDVYLAPWGDSINTGYINLDFTDGTHSIDITVNKTSRRANAIYIFCSNKAGKSADVSSIALNRYNEEKEVLSFLSVNNNLTISSDLLPSSTTQSRFSISGILEGDQDHELYTIKLSAHNGNYYGSAAVPQLNLTSEAVENNHTITDENTITNNISQVVEKQVTVSWYSENDLSFEDNSNAVFGFGAVLRAPSAEFKADNFIAIDTASSGTISYKSTTNINNISTSDAWITIPSTSTISLNGFTNLTNFANGSFEATFSANTTGSTRAGSISINNSYNTGAADDTINIIQAPAGDFVNIYNPSSNVTFTAGEEGYPIVSSINTDDYVDIEVLFACDQSTLDINDLSVTIGSGDAGWLSLPGSIDSASTIQMGNFYAGMYLYNVIVRATTVDASLTSRTATLRVAHPDTPATFDEISFTQNIFDPATDTLVTSIPGGSSFGTGSYTAELRLTSSVTGSPTPVVVLEQAKAWADPVLSNNNVNNVTGNYETVDDFVTLGEVQVVTGEPYTHKVNINISSFANADGNDLRTQKITVYHVNDIGQTTPKKQNIAQSYIFNVDEETGGPE